MKNRLNSVKEFLAAPGTLKSRVKSIVRLLTTMLVLIVAFMTSIIALGCGVPVWLVALSVGLPVLGYCYRKYGRNFLRAPATAFCVLLVAGCAIATADKPAYQSAQEQISNKIAERLVAAVPYPINLITDSLERRMLRERLLRFNHASKTGYVYVFNLGVQKPIGYYVIRGKVSATESQLTNPDQTWNGDNGNIGTAASIQDDGSWGHEEGGPNGIFFFTSSGVMAESVLPWLYLDAPSPLWTDVPQISPPSQSPSSTSTLWKQNNGLGGG